ncbi:PREDICTED: uncharacterized protein LOC109333961 [Lupinus angustifolius]|uniref:uncharacterized protein LOC109333961 n=1 Tax=Lupinus angustifolius TaxID=3871 RepID=UPI00092E45ED|nr:PREDICTED: uncharacterized protein LOC109333961 [Lupinus angustifolius]
MAAGILIERHFDPNQENLMQSSRSESSTDSILPFLQIISAIDAESNASQQQQQLQTTDSSENPTNSYYPHPGEYPGIALVTPPLDGNNYHSWSRSMRRALSSKNKFKFVNGSIQAPQETDPNFDSWETCNTMIISWITRLLTQQIAQNIVYIEVAQEL